ncbi:hypothetical protein ACFFGH_06505 [Lysobacter korlensis]|uniref:Uncharacterized protein n=1 Tax=Lysobacter korlensis TaxID=553636 RepID=A0ABV6RKJ3_9GAMM
MSRATFEVGRDPPTPEPERADLKPVPVDETTRPSPRAVERARDELARIKARNRRDAEQQAELYGERDDA